jgi:hypothetical protein
MADRLEACERIVVRTATLIHRPIAIHVFDARQDGPIFGARALLALTAPGGRLHGLEIQFQHHPYDWSDTAPLARLLDGLAARGAIIATSSEGGLFEYGSDDVVVANLTALALVGVPIVAGSVTSSSEVRKRMIAQTRFRFFARGLEGFAPLAERSGYAIADSHTAVLSEQVLLRPRAPPPNEKRFRCRCPKPRPRQSRSSSASVTTQSRWVLSPASRGRAPTNLHCWRLASRFAPRVAEGFSEHRLL